MGRKVPQAQNGVDLVEPCLEFRKMVLDDARAGIVEAVAHVGVASKFVPQDVADDGLTFLIEIDINGVFIAINVLFQQPVVAVNNRLRILLGPALCFGGNVAFGGQPVCLIADAVYAKAEKTYCWFENAGHTHFLEGQCLHFCQVQAAVVIVRVQRAQELARERLVLELANSLGQSRGAVLRHPGQGIFRAGVQARRGRGFVILLLPVVQHGGKAGFGHKVEPLLVLHLKSGCAGPRHIVVEHGFLPGCRIGQQLRRNIGLVKNNHSPPSTRKYTAGSLSRPASSVR